MKNKGYTVIKMNQHGEITLETLEKINGYQVKPKNQCNYKNIKVNSMVIIKPSFIEKVLKKKIKRKLEYYFYKNINGMLYVDKVQFEKYQNYLLHYFMKD